MSELSLEELERAATAYEALLVPAFFQDWASRVVEVAGLGAGDRVLDVACGTGILARAAAMQVGKGGSVAGVDLNPGMLAVAERIAPQIKWQAGSAEELPFSDEEFDAVVSQFGLMFFADPQAALQEMLRVLKSGGRLVVAVFDRPDQIPAYAAMADVLERIVGKGVADALRFPFSMGNPEALVALFEEAGMPSVNLNTEVRTAHFPSVRAMVMADVEGWFPIAQIHLDESTIETVIAEAKAALAPFVMADGTVTFPVSAHLVTATKS